MESMFSEGIDSWAVHKEGTPPLVAPTGLVLLEVEGAGSLTITSVVQKGAGGTMTIEWEMPTEGPLCEMACPAPAPTVDDAPEPVVLCSHSMSTGKNVVKKPGPNQGRTFYSCPVSRYQMCKGSGRSDEWEEDPCGIFFFRDDPAFAEWARDKEGPLNPAPLSKEPILSLESLRDCNVDDEYTTRFAKALMGLDPAARAYAEHLTEGQMHNVNLGSFAKAFARRVCSITDDREALWGGGQRTDAWFRARQARITASSAGQALGDSRFVTQANFLRHILWSPVQAGSFKAPPLLFGTRHEETAERIYASLLVHMGGGDVRAVGTWVNKARPWLSASPDGVVVGGGTGPPRLWLLEIKTPYKLRARAAGEPFYPVNRQSGLPIPEEYLNQMAVQMATTGLLFVDFVVLAPTGLQVTRVHRDRPYVMRLIRRLWRFYRDVIFPSAYLQTCGLLPPAHLQLQPGHAKKEGRDGALKILDLFTCQDAMEGS